MEGLPRADWPGNFPADLLLSVVIPVYNECATVTEVLRRVRAAPMACEIIVVDDSSSDGTRELLRSLPADPELRIIYQPSNCGKGAALKTGFMEATGDIVVVQDADLEYHPDDYPRLITPILRNEADVVYGSRFLTRTGCRLPHFRNVLGNRFLTGLSNIFTGLGLTDMETGYKVFRREIIQKLAPRLRERRFGIEPELTARIARGGYRVREVSIRYDGRSYGEGKKIGWRDGLRAMWCIARYWKWD
jgi:glycosyltransferase involved in cell wall biosynthesis